MSETWYRINEWSVKIEPVLILKHTTHFVTLEYKDWQGKPRESRQGRKGFFPTFAEAKQALVKDFSCRVENAKKSLQEHRSRLGQAQSLKEPQLTVDQNFCDETAERVQS